MPLQHVIYGSATGLGDYRMLAASPHFDDRFRATILKYANLEGTAANARFAPIYSFYAISAEERVFSRTMYLGSSARGNDYLVHSLILGKNDLTALDYRPFRLDDAGCFVSDKPAQGVVLVPIEIATLRFAASRSEALDAKKTAACLRALSRRPLRLRMEDDSAAGIIRAIHDALPPTDRVQTTFCTRFSYGRKLDFQLAGYLAADEQAVREQSAGAELMPFPPNANGSHDLFDRWAAEARNEPDFDLVGLSILRDPEETFALIEGVRQLRVWSAGSAAQASRDVEKLRKPAALVLHRDNRDRAAVQMVLPGAFAVDLCSEVEASLRAGRPFEAPAQRCAEMRPAVRRSAAEWIRTVSSNALQAWIAETLLLLPDAPLGMLVDVISRRDRDRMFLLQLHAENSTAYRAFGSVVLARLRERFGAEGGRAAASLVPLLAQARDATVSFVRTFEETARGEHARVWLRSIVQAVLLETELRPQMPARLILDHGLLASIQNAQEIARVVPALITMEDPLEAALASIAPTSAPVLYRALAAGLDNRIRQPWTPQTTASVALVKRIVAGASHGTVIDATTARRLTAIAFLSGSIFPDAARKALADAVGPAVDAIARSGVGETGAVLLIKTIQTFGRTAPLRVQRRTVTTLRNVVSHRKANESILMCLRWHLRMRALSEATV